MSRRPISGYLGRIVAALIVPNQDLQFFFGVVERAQGSQTIANILGFLPDIPSNYVNGKVLKSALK